MTLLTRCARPWTWPYGRDSQRELRSPAARIRADAEGRYASAEPGWQAGVEWTLLWIENTASQLTEGKPKQAGGG
ncbi:hypothetical protein GCM10010320_80830 [Streptomyces caelestis]|nr:hypothetical protein GCM10010320_80830 [Streptomyces caelestis]